MRTFLTAVAALALAAGVPAGVSNVALAAQMNIPRDAPTVSGAWARPTLGAAGTSAVYLTLTGGRTADALTGAATPAAGRLELHRSGMAGGMMQMAPVASLPVPAGGVVRLAPGGLHLMLMAPRRPLKVGDRIPVTLRFARAGAVTVQAQVRSTPP